MARIVLACILLLAFGCTCAKPRELSRCSSLDGAYEAVLVEPPGQWQDQFVQIIVKDRAGAEVVRGQVGFASGTVDALAWAANYRLAATSGPTFVPRVWVDVPAARVGGEEPYTEKAPPLDTWTRMCRAVPVSSTR